MRAAAYPAGSLAPEKINRIPTRGEGSSPEERLIEVIRSVWPVQDSVAAIGVALPGPIEQATGTLVRAPNIPEFSNFPVRDLLFRHFRVPVAVGNDANLAALGEWQYGAGRGHKHLLYLTVSTGIGSGVIIDGQLLEGARGFAPELGHTTIMVDGPLCGCGQRGHLEALAAGPAIARWAQEEIARGAPSSLPANQNLTALQVSQAAQNGDALALAAFHRGAYFLGIGIANFLHAFNPTIIVLGGGVSASYHLFAEQLQQSVRQHLMSPDFFDQLTFATAQLGDDTGLMGSLAYARRLAPE
jgi:glucokinase